MRYIDSGKISTASLCYEGGFITYVVAKIQQAMPTASELDHARTWQAGEAVSAQHTIIKNRIIRQRVGLFRPSPVPSGDWYLAIRGERRDATPATLTWTNPLLGTS